MKLSVNEITLMQQGDLLSHIKSCGQNGFRYMEVRKLALLRALREGHTLDEIAGALREYGVSVPCVNAVESITFHTSRSLRLMKEAAEYLFYCSRQLGCDCIEVIASFRAPTDDENAINDETAKMLTELSDLARPFGLRLALEYMGLPDSSVKTLRQSLDIVDRVGREDVGILLDTWHHYAYGSAPEDVLLAKKGQIGFVHVSDCPARAPGTALRSESYLPGVGVVPITEILRNVRAVGYDGVVSAEVFDAAVQAMEPAACLGAIRETMTPVLAAAGF